MEELLERLGFKNMTGPLWKHEKIGIIHITDKHDVNDLVKIIYDRGYSECQLMIRISLGINPG